MPRQATRAAREAALGRYQDETYKNQALADARQAWDAEQIALTQRIEELEAELKLAKNKRQSDRNALKTMAEKLAAFEDSEPVGKLKRREDQVKHAKRIVAVLNRYVPADRASLLMSALRISSQGCDHDLREDIPKTKSFKVLLRAIHAARDKQIVKHLKEECFTADAFSMLRLIIGMSRRDCGLMQQVFKHKRLSNGKRRRFRLAPDSKEPVPEIFSLPEIVAYEDKAEKASKLELQAHDDKRGADVAGKQFAIDQVILNELEFDHARHGGMATDGTPEDPHLWMVTGDGAGLSAMYSGIRMALFPGSTQYLNQSANDCTTIAFYKVSRLRGAPAVTLPLLVAHGLSTLTLLRVSCRAIVCFS